MFDHVQGLSYSELDRLGTATLITRLTNDINQVQNGLNMGLRLLLRSPFIVLGSMVMAFTINVRCAWCLLWQSRSSFLLFLLLCISAFRFSVKFREIDRVTGLTRENLTGVRVIRAFCGKEKL